MNCEFSGCGSLATVYVRWRGTSQQSETRYATVCPFHSREIWDKLKPALSVGTATFTIWPVDTPLPVPW